MKEAIDKLNAAWQMYLDGAITLVEFNVAVVQLNSKVSETLENVEQHITI